MRRRQFLKNVYRYVSCYLQFFYLSGSFIVFLKHRTLKRKSVVTPFFGTIPQYQFNVFHYVIITWFTWKPCCWLSVLLACRPGQLSTLALKSVFRIHIQLNTDPNPAKNLNTDPDPGPGFLDSFPKIFFGGLKLPFLSSLLTNIN